MTRTKYRTETSIFRDHVTRWPLCIMSYPTGSRTDNSVTEPDTRQVMIKNRPYSTRSDSDSRVCLRIPHVDIEQL